MKETIELTKKKMKHELTDEEFAKWTDWHWQVAHTVHDIDTVEAILGIRFSDEKRSKIEETVNKFPMSISPYYLSLIDPTDYLHDPVFKQAFPDEHELIMSDWDMHDPLHEDTDSPVEGITHRYPDRVLFLVSNVCAMYCRHCTRKRKVGDVDYIPSKETIEKGLDYIRNTPTVRDVLFSGGDPLMLPDEYLDWILGEVKKIPHVEVMRIGTRIPVVLPYRVTSGLIDVLKKYDNLWINTQYNHPRELTNASKIAVKKLVMAGIPLGNQSVLLNGVNDCTRIMRKLLHKLITNRVRPYYLYQCDLSEGLEHFRTSVGKGIEIMESLRGHTSGFAIPTYVIDAPGGGGKIPIMPNYVISRSSNKIILRNYEGVITTYHLPENYYDKVCKYGCEKCNLNLEIKDGEEFKLMGVSRLLGDFEDDIYMEPKNLDRENRNGSEK